jgi:hypothetical protein
MGFFDSIAQGFNDMFFEPEITNGVEGTAQVVSASGYVGRALYQNCTLDLVVEGPGIPATATKVTCLVHYKHWPVVGGSLPVLIERDDPKEVVVQWEKVPDVTMQAMDQAERIAAARRASGNPYSPGTTVKIVGDVSAITPEQKAKLLALGIDFDKLTADAG